MARGEKIKDRLIRHHDPEDRWDYTPGKPYRNPENRVGAALWMIRGYESKIIENNPRNRYVTFHALTDDPYKLPDPYAAYAHVSRGSGTLISLCSIDYVTKEFTEFGSDTGDDSIACYLECANQTSRSMEPSISTMLGSLILQLRETESRFNADIEGMNRRLVQAKRQLSELKKEEPDNHFQRSELYRGVLIVWDSDRDERIRTMIDSLPDAIRGRLLMAHEREGTLNLIWTGDGDPVGYAKNDSIDVDGDVWYIYNSIIINGSISEGSWSELAAYRKSQGGAA